MGCRTGGLAGQWGSPRPRSATAWTCCCPSWPPSGTASPTGGSSPPLKTCANGLGRWPQPARRSWSTGSAPGCSGPPAGSTRRSCTTPSGTPIPPRGWRCRPSGATCCGATVAGRAAATSRSSSSWRGWARCWTPPAWRACWTGGFGAWPRPVRTGTRRSGTAGPKTGSATRSGRSTACRRGCARWWSSRSGIWPTRGRCVAGGGCCTGSGTSTGPPASSFAWAGGCTGSPHEGARSITDTLIGTLWGRVRLRVAMSSAGGVVGWEERQFSEFFASQYRRLRRLGFLLTGDWVEGEELAQEALVQVYWRWALVRRQEHPEAYARKVLINRHRSLLRRLRLEVRHAGQARIETADAGQREELLVVWAAIRRLPARQRAVVVLRYHEDLPELEVARLLRMPVGTVKSTANRALARLRKDLAGRLVDHADSRREPR